MNINPPKRDWWKDPKWEPIPIVGIRGTKMYYFDSCYHAARILRARNPKTMARNILKVIKGVRRTIKCFRWFYYSDPSWRELVEKI